MHKFIVLVLCNIPNGLHITKTRALFIHFILILQKPILFSLSFTGFSLLVITQFINGGYNIAMVKGKHPDPMPIGFGSKKTVNIVR